jgi:hypothetical protein
MFLAPVLAASQCKPTESRSDSGVDAESDADGDPKPSGVACATAVECASGFCADGVCCDDACSDTCYGCGQPGSVGTCTPISDGDDPSAIVPCGGATACFVDASGVPACKLRDKVLCSADDECGSGLCRTYFADADADGYGVSSSTVRICDTASAAPPVGYAAVGNDCCDTDAHAHPGSSGYSTVPDACGSFDWDCDGTLEHQTAMQCPSATTLACGTACLITIPKLGSSMKLFTEACR